MHYWYDGVDGKSELKYEHGVRADHDALVQNLASGIVNTSYQIGSALGLGAMTAIAALQGAEEVGALTA